MSLVKAATPSVLRVECLRVTRNEDKWATWSSDMQRRSPVGSPVPISHREARFPGTREQFSLHGGGIRSGNAFESDSSRLNMSQKHLPRSNYTFVGLRASIHEFKVTCLATAAGMSPYPLFVSASAMTSVMAECSTAKGHPHLDLAREIKCLTG